LTAYPITSKYFRHQLFKCEGYKTKPLVERFNSELSEYNNANSGADIPLLNVDTDGDIDNASRDATLNALAELAGTDSGQLTITLRAQDGILDADTPIKNMANIMGHLTVVDGIRDGVESLGENNPLYNPNQSILGQPNVAEAVARLNRTKEILDTLD
jgi:hypothetical protein